MVQTLPHTPTVTIRDVRCQGTCRHQSARECATSIRLVLRYRGVYGRHQPAVLIPCGGRRYSRYAAALKNPVLVRSFRQLLARVSVLFGVLVLVCVPGLTRMSQKLETASHTPSFAKNIDCPPKKVTVAPAAAVASPVPLATFDVVRPVRFVPRPAAALPAAPHLVGPRPLRAPPLARLA